MGTQLLPILDEKSQKVIEDTLLKPMVDKLMAEQQPSSLEPPHAKRTRLLEQLRKSFNDYQSFFEHAGQLLQQAGFKAERVDDASLQRLMSNPNEQIERMASQELSVQEVVQISRSEMHRIYKLACEHYGYENYSNARDLFLLLITLRDNDAFYWSGLAMAEQRLGHYETAIMAYAKAAEYNPNDPSVVLYAANCLRLQNRLSDALQVLDALIEDINGEEPWQKLKQQAAQLKEEWQAAA